MSRKITCIEHNYRQKRYNRYDKNNLNIKHLSGHRIANGILVLLIKIQRLFKRQKLIVINDKRRETDKPFIFSPTHIGGLDIEITFEAIRKEYPSQAQGNCRIIYSV